MKLKSIKEVRLEMRCTLREFGALTGFSHSYIDKVEKAKKPASERLKKAVNKVFADAQKKTARLTLFLENND